MKKQARQGPRKAVPPPPKIPARRRKHRGNGNAGQPILIGVHPTEKHMATRPGEFPTPSIEGAYRSPALQPISGSRMMEEVAYADPYRLFPGKPGEGQFVYNPGVLVTRKGYLTIDEMRRDEQVKAALTFKKHAVIAAGWSVDPPEGRDEDDEVTEFVRQNLERMQGSFERTLLEILTALDYGFSIAERVYEEREDQPKPTTKSKKPGRKGGEEAPDEEDADVRANAVAKGKKLWLRALKVRRPHTFEFAQDAFGNVTGLRQQQRDLPVDKFVIYSYDYEFSNPYGRSDLEACYRAWWTKRNAYMWLAMMLERLGIPPIFVLYNPNDYGQPERQTLQTLLRNLQSGTVGLFPRPNEDSAEFWAPELAGQVTTVFIPAMDKFDKDISRGLLMPGLMGMTADDKQGSMARSKVHFDVFMLVLERIRSEVQERVMQEQVIKPLVALNFGDLPDEEIPQFKFLPLTDERTAELLEKWVALVAGQVVTPTDEDERFIRQAMEFPEFDEDAAAERTQRKADEQLENTKAQIDAGVIADPTKTPPSPFGGGKGGFGKGGGKPFGKSAPANDDFESQKKMTLTDEQFNVILDELREAAEASE